MTTITGHTTLTELRLRHAELEAQAQRLRDRAVGMDPTRATTAATMRRIRTVQRRADEYAEILRRVAGPSLDRMEEDVVAALNGVLSGGDGGSEALEPGLKRARALMGSLFEHWRSQS